MWCKLPAVLLIISMQQHALRQMWNVVHAQTLQGSADGLKLPCPVQVVTDHPPVLCYNPEERIIPFFDFLKSIGIPPEKVAKRPTLLGLEVNKSLRRIVNYLQEVEGKSIDEVAVLLETI